MQFSLEGRRGLVAGGKRWSSVRGRSLSRLRCNRAVAFRSAIAEELPDLADFRDHVQIEIRYDHFVFVTAGLGDNFSAWIAEVALAVELTNVPRFFNAHAVDGADKITVGHGMRGLLQFPQVF